MSNDATGPLTGIRVLDLTRYLAGPFCTMLLADYGADVVKVESRKGREFRAPGSARDSYFFLSSNRGKRSLTLDFRSERGQQVLLRCLEGFDVLVELSHPEVGRFKTTGLPVKLSESPGRIRGAPPRLGEHTDEVLLECGLARAEIETLRADGVI